MKQRTRYSFFYLAGYLFPTGIGMLLVPDTILKVLFSSREYDDVFVRFRLSLAGLMADRSVER